MNNSEKHLEFERILEKALRRLPGGKTADPHLESCLECRRTYLDVSELVVNLAGDEFEEVPEHVIARAVQLFKDHRAEASAAGFVKKLVARIVSDEQLGMTPAFGLRSGGQENVRRLWLETEGGEVDLRISKTAEEWTLAGQVFGDFAAGTAHLDSAVENHTVRIGTTSDFSFPRLAAGDYSLTLKFEDAEIEIPTLTIGS